MIDLNTITEEISRLEREKASYPVCQKLADLYVVKDHLMNKGGQYNYDRGGRSNYGYYERGGGNSGGGSSYGYYPMMMEDDMGMGMERSHMSSPSMR